MAEPTLVTSIVLLVLGVLCSKWFGFQPAWSIILEGYVAVFIGGASYLVLRDRSAGYLHRSWLFQHHLAQIHFSALSDFAVLRASAFDQEHWSSSLPTDHIHSHHSSTENTKAPIGILGRSSSKLKLHWWLLSFGLLSALAFVYCGYFALVSIICHKNTLRPAFYDSGLP